jgi:hypothetical protein
MPANIEQIGNSSMGVYKTLSLPHRFELPHPSLPDPGRLVRLVGTVIFILLSTVDRLGNQCHDGLD